MDIEQLRRINTLSHELKRYGMAESSSDAYAQAQQIVTITPKPTFAPAPQASLVIEAAPLEPLTARQFQLEIEQARRVFADEINALHTAINNIIAEVNSLRDDLSKLQAAQPPKPKEKQVELQTPKEAHPRQGDWKPGDVDIQKMFYFGKK